MKKRISRDGAQIVVGLRPLAVPIGLLRPDPKNARRHPDRNLEAVKASLARYGQRKPVVVNKRTGFIEAGNATWEAAKALGWQTLAAVYVQDDPRTAVGYAIADNRTAELAEWDDAALLKILQTLKLDGELAHVGFDDGELDRLLRELQPPREETFNVAEALRAAPELAERVKRGQVWGLGRHRLMCGDATARKDVSRLIGTRTLALVTTDPPYGVDYANVLGGRENQKAVGWPEIVGDNLDDGSLYGLVRTALGNAAAPVVFCWHSWKKVELFLRAVRDAGWEPIAEIVWVKNALVFGRSDYQWRHECCIYGKRAGSRPQEDRTQTTVWEFPKEHAPNHPTQKPIGLFEIPMLNHTGPNEAIYDPFLGSGTALVAAERTGRVGLGMEIEPRYCAVAIARWEAYSGESAVLLDG